MLDLIHKNKNKRKGVIHNLVSLMSFKMKLIIGIIILIVCMLLGVTFLLYAWDNMEDLDRQLPEVTENTSRPIYDGTQAQVTVIDQSKQQMKFEEIMDKGNFNASEAQILAALQQLNIQVNDSFIKGGTSMYDYQVKFLKNSLVPFISVYIDCSLWPSHGMIQGALESEWGKKTPPGSNNFFGIKGDGKHTKYWKGEYVSSWSGEAYDTTGGKSGWVSKFRKYNSFYDSVFDWAEFLKTNKRYTTGEGHILGFYGDKANVFKATDGVNGVARVMNAGYAPGSEGEYMNFARGAYKRQDLKRFDDLAVKVKSIIAREGGAYTTPNGKQIPNSEWKPSTVGDSKWGYFCDPAKGRISSYFGARTNPVTGKHESAHGAIDYAVPTGTKIYAARSGVVVDSRYSSSYGNVIAIDHGDDYFTRYAHNSKLLVKKGDKVVRGQNIAISGSTGWSTGPHTHFEILKGWDVNAKKNGIDPLATFYMEYRYKDTMRIKPRDAKNFDEQHLTADPGEVAGIKVAQQAGFSGTTPNKPTTNLVQSCSFLNEQGINPSSLSKERLAVFYEGHKWFGSWYAWGGKTPPKRNSDGSWQMPHRTGGWAGGYALAGPGFDCSGYVGWIFKQVFGINIGDGSEAQGYSKYVKLVDDKETKPGDLYWHRGHIAIAVKCDDKYIYVMQSPQTGEKIGWGKFRRSQPHRIVRPTFFKD